MSAGYLKSKLEIEHDRFKVGVSLVVIVSTGLTGLILKSDWNIKYMLLFLSGFAIDFILVLYVIKLYLKVNKILKRMEVENA